MATEFERLVLGALNVLLGDAAAPTTGTAKKEATTYYEDWLYRSRKLLEDGNQVTTTVTTIAPLTVTANAKDAQ